MVEDAPGVEVQVAVDRLGVAVVAVPAAAVPVVSEALVRVARLHDMPKSVLGRGACA